jgi:hypothetical protein
MVYRQVLQRRNRANRVTASLPKYGTGTDRPGATGWTQSTDYDVGDNGNFLHPSAIS